MEVKGNCLCKAVQVTVKKMDMHIGICHCGMCRRWASGPFMAVDCGTEVSFVGEENISLFDSSAWAERGFCKKCGTLLFYRLKKNKQHIMGVALFPSQPNFTLSHEIFIDDKPAYYEFANETKKMTGAEVIGSLK